MAIFLGLDCGGSSSRALALDESGNRVYERSSGSANLSSTPYARLRRNLNTVLQGAPAPTSVCGCFAGLIDEETRQTALEILREAFPSARLAAVPDFAAAFHAFEEPQDVCTDQRAGHPYANEIMEKNFGELAQIVKTHVERYLPGRRNLRLGLAGGLWRGSSNLRDGVLVALQRAMPDKELILTPIKHPPVYGAVILAKELMIGN